MAYRTFLDLKTQIDQELDLESEDFIQPTEMVNYFNSAMSIVEAEIITLGLREKYLETSSTISTVTGTADYDMPSDMIDTKIRKAMYNNGVNIYEIKPFLGEDVYEYEKISNLYSANEEYFYKVVKNQTDGVWKFRLLPKASATVVAGITLWYLKDLNRYDDDDTECDVPTICYEYILAFVRYKCLKKEIHVNTEVESAELKEIKELMVASLQGQIADPNRDKIDMDMSSYQESS